MPPKKRSNKSAAAAHPRKKAKVGAIFSGISRAGPGDVDIGSMAPDVAGGPSVSFKVASIFSDDHNVANDSGDIITESVTNLSETVAPIPSPIPAVQLGTFCHYCCDQVSPAQQHDCVECGAVVCEQYLARSSGCIFLKTIEVGKSEFLCPQCARTGDERNSPLRYAFIGFGRRKKVKMMWPMAIVNLNLESMKDDYLAKTVVLDVENHFRSFKQNLFTSTLHMRGGAHVSESRKLAPGVEFFRGNIAAGFPPNTFIIVDTHSDEYTGMLQHTGGHSGGTNTTITEILTAYLGADFLEMMKKSSDAARSDTTEIKTLRGNTPWCKLTPSARGGWRGLFMVSCGPAIRVSHHFFAVKELVQKNVVDFVLAFGGSGTLPSMIASIVRTFISDIGVFGKTDIWSAVCDMLASSNDFLDYTTAVVVFASTIDGRRIVECRQIGKDIAGLRAFGYEFKSCPTPGCQPTPADMRVFNNGPKVSLRCLKCTWRSTGVRNDEENQHFKKVNKVVAPQLFWHHFPASYGLQNFFVELTDSANKAKAKSAERGMKSKRQLQADMLEDANMLEVNKHYGSMVIDG
ncbi:hypothetical protein DEU56DRAFT_918171 [Suillus clintonianus]|uniref:uncharacterized protein n=1 Tax=Suillus clintonianus TaxID=1904413 RepID=UPI001B86B6B9|nr:uncharacterized protein DEU56DRAFT_918171 [Suillus clintonianus]KAG2121485.1 hypothetical protein DEU56DRAFT_918171 [Suillus clintonianus]